MGGKAMEKTCFCNPQTMGVLSTQWRTPHSFYRTSTHWRMILI